MKVTDFNRVVCLIVLLAGILIQGNSATAKQFQHVSVDLVSDVDTVQPGAPFQLGLHFKLQKDWHLYWQNPGDAGMAPVVEWVVPPGFDVSELKWPIPERLIEKNIGTYVYKNDVLLAVTVIPPQDLIIDKSFKFEARVDWLLCKNICVAGNGNIELEMNSAESGVITSKHQDLFKTVSGRIPKSFPTDWQVTAQVSDSHLQLTILTGEDRSAKQHSGSFSREFYPITGSLILNTAPNQLKQVILGQGEATVYTYKLVIPLDPMGIDLPDRISGVLTDWRLSSNQGKADLLSAFAIDLQLEKGAVFEGGK